MIRQLCAIVIVGKTEYLDKIENLVNDIRKFEKNNLENDVCFSFAINQEKQVDNIFKKIIVSDDIFGETKRFLNQLTLGQI